MPENKDNSAFPQPAISVFFDAGTQRVHVPLDPTQVHNWDFALALLNMATRAVENQVKLQQMAAIQAQAAEQQRSQQIIRSLRN